MTHILVVDEDRAFCRLVGEHLIREGMTVQFAHDGRSGLKFALTGHYDLVVLRERLPELNGLQVTKHLRANSEIGLMILGSCGKEVDKIIALECGADDYLDNPFSPRELIARIRAITRRVKQSPAGKLAPSPECFEIDDLVLDERSRECRRNGQFVNLTAAEFDLLTVFLRCSGRVIHRNELSRKVLDRDYSPFDRSIDVHVSNLRRKLGTSPNGSERIRSVRSIGYIYAYSSPVQLHGTEVSDAAILWKTWLP